MYICVDPGQDLLLQRGDAPWVLSLVEPASELSRMAEASREQGEDMSNGSLNINRPAQTAFQRAVVGYPLRENVCCRFVCLISAIIKKVVGPGERVDISIVHDATVM